MAQRQRTLKVSVHILIGKRIMKTNTLKYNIFIMDKNLVATCEHNILDA